MDLILVYGDYKKFKIFHSQEASCWISSHFCKVVSKPAAHLEKHGDAFFCHVEVYRSIFKSSIHPFSLRDSTVSTEAWFYKERRDNVNSECHFSRTKTSLKRNISGSSSSGRNMCTLVRPFYLASPCVLSIIWLVPQSLEKNLDTEPIVMANTAGISCFIPWCFRNKWLG